MSKQIVVVKGWEGFADRLQVLSHCMQYCIVNDASICVDWRDEMWGQGETDFHDYFELIGIDTIRIESVVERMVSGATVYPSSWSISDISTPMNKLISMKNTANKNTDMLNDYTPIQSDIIVIKNGFRKFHIMNMLQNLAFTKDVSEIVQSKIAKVVLPFTAVHLRGTDRMAESIETVIANTILKYEQLPIYKKKRVFVLSDMKCMVDSWLEKQPHSIHTNPDNCISKIDMGAEKCEGTHTLPKEVYDYYGISKREMNIDTLSDFVVLAMANWCVGNIETESCFTKMSRFIYNNAGHSGISVWLGEGYVPPRAPYLSTGLPTDVSPKNFS